MIRWVSILSVFLFVTESSEAQSSPCYFDIVPFTVNSDVRYELSQNPDLDVDGDDIYCSALRIGDLIAKGNVDIADKEFIDLVNREMELGSPSEDLLKIVFKYSLFLEDRNQRDRANIYYAWIVENANKDSYVRALAVLFRRISIGNESVISNTVDSLFNLYVGDEFIKQIGLLRMIYRYKIYDFESVYSCGENISLALEQNVYAPVRYSFLHQLLECEEMSAEQKLQLRRELDYIVKQGFDPDKSFRLGEEALEKHNYDEYLEISKRAVVSSFGSYDSIDSLIAIYHRKKFQQSFTIRRLAHSKLFQTRAGGGLTDVEEAYSLYEAFYNYGWLKRVGNIRGLSSSEIRGREVGISNLMIIAGYLLEKTGDEGWVDRTMSTMDNNKGLGLQHWVNSRNFLRQDAVYKKLLERAEINQENLLGSLTRMPLNELVEKEFVLNEHWENVQQRYVLINEEHDNESLVQVIREQSSKDHSGYVEIFSNGGQLFRVFITLDTAAITPIHHVRPIVLQKMKELNRALLTARNATATDSLSYPIYQALFSDIAHLLPEKLHIVATGPMADIPFSALRTTPLDEPARYLGLDHVISRQFSIRSMQMLNDLELEAAVPRPLAMAPDFDDEFVAASELRQAGFALPPLLYNREEVEFLEELSDGTFLYDDKATLENYWDHAADHSILHIASHAISSEVDGVKSRVFFAGDGDRASALQAANVGDQTLNADLVVLSACETGGGGLHVTEGKVGLTKAYLAAGARSVVSSSWAVDDHATAEMMKSFYTHIKAGDPPNVALQKARLAYVERHPDASPAKWAAFEAYGGMRPVRWEPEAPFEMPWGWVLGGVVALAGAGYGMRRRKLRA